MSPKFLCLVCILILRNVFHPSAWQHVDCMGIDRQNIPDEYLCELCQPRPVDKARARALQVQKRKEQTQLMLVQAQAVAAASTTGAAGSASGGANVANIPNELLTSQQRLSAGGLGGFGLNSAHSSDPGGLHQIATGVTNMKKGTKVLKKVKESVAGKKTKKADKLSAAAGSGLTGKAGRKETKKNTKRKKSSHDGSSGSTVGMTAAEKYAANIKQWSDHYEIAATNHYSPELRARLHSITKQPSLLQSILNTENPILKEYGKDELEHIAATVPHAGGKILISNLDIKPNSPICELRGKYMLTTQFKIQNTSINMNNPPPNNYQLASYKAHKTPGPFIFFYQLQGAEFTVNHGGGSGGNGSMSGQGQTTTTTTINPDGTFTTTTTTLPAQLSPPIFQKGPEICVDTRTYGNKARFVRRSCRPNAEIQHLFEKGTIHLFIVALADISANTEITIRHEPHDLLAVENKKTTTMVIQPTSTPCACGLSKDCIFGPPLPQLPPAAKSNAGRKSLALNGGGSTSAGAAMGNQSAKQRKAYQQNLNRNRSTSSSGDSNMGGSVAPLTPTIPTVALSLNSPNSLLNNKMCKNALGGNNVNGPMTLLPLTGSCNSNMSNASSSSSTLAGIMPDSGICTSSSSPSVSIPSPTPHMHSPIQQQQHQQQQSVQNSHLSQTQLIQQQQQQQQLQTQLPMRPAQLVVPPQQQQQQLMQSLPTPLILTTDMQQPILQQHQHHEQHHEQQQPAQQHQQVLLQSPQNLVHQQPLTVIAQAATATLISQEIAKEQTEQVSGHLHISTAPPSHLISQMAQPQLQLISPHHLQHHQQQTLTATLTPCSADVTAASPETAVAATALQSLNCSQTSNLEPAMDKLPSTQLVVMSGPMAATTPTAGVDIKLEEQAENIVVPVNQPPLGDSQVLTTQEMSNLQSGATTTVMASTVCSSANSSPQQKSPQKNSQTHAMHSHQGRKTPAKHGRTTSFSEDNDGGQHNDENAVSSAPNSSSTPKEKPKLSREDRKMEAILRAIEKMERNQQRKQEQKQSKRQNSGSHNTTPTSPNKTFDSADSSGTKRSNSQCGGPTRNKKKRKAGNRSAAHSNQRKRRQSRMNSQESIDGCGPQENDTVTSESDGCNAMLSPPIQTMAPLKDSPIAAAPNSTPVNALSCEAIPNNVDQAAGLLMAFANPPTIVNSIIQPTTTTTTSPPVLIPEVESPQRPAQYMMSSHESATSPPPTPPSHVSSACLLIEAAVGPLESSNLDTSSPTDIKDSEFKYPLQTKTKKLLMNNWLHRTEETTAPDMEQTTPHPLQAPAPQLSCVTGGLESLVQAALNDFKQSHVEENEMPQNLSFVAQRVEEFIQQTEGGPPTPPPTKHSYEYEHQQQQQMYAMSAPAVDLSVKQHTTTLPPAISGVTKSSPTQNSTKNFHLPLQVSTCSNNSSVKKRWLRQAISEETHEETQNSYSMSPNNTTTPLTAAPPSSVNAFTMNPIVQQVHTTSNSSCSPALTTNSVPNGFTTPLKKRRLLLTDDKDEEDSVVTTVAMNSGEMQPSTPMSPPPVEAAIIVQPDNSLHKPEEYKAEVNQEAQEDVDVDVEKCEHNETTALEHHQQASTCTEHDQEQDQDQDVDVTSPPYEEQRVESEVVTKHENDLEIKKEPMEDSHNANVTTIVGSSQPQEFNDQEDDVDILRSPSPGREMIKAEDNLVKIEPEDTSGNEDVKIDVEREESMPAEDIVEPTTLKQEYKEEVTLNRPHENSEVSLKVEDVELKQEQKVVEKFENIPHHKEQKRPVEESKDKLLQVEKVENPEIKDEDTSKGDEDGDFGGEPKPKRIKLENIPAEIETTKPQQQQQQQTATVIVVKNEAKLLPLTPSLGKELKEEEPEENVLMKQTDVIKCEKLSTDTEEVSSTTSSVASQVVAKVAADSTFSGIESSTPPPHTVPPATVTPTQASCTSTVSPTPSLQRSKTLSDDDIQARLHNFHKENILFLQSRNKKSKSSNSSTSCNAMVNSCSSSSSGGSEHHRNSHKSNASSSSTNHHHHHHHHETSGGKERSEKSDKCSSKHHKNSSSSTTSLSGSSKKQKLHKRERTTSSSSSSNSHKNSSSQISSSSSATPTSSSKHPAVNSSINSLPSSSSCSASATASYSSSSSKKLKSLKKSSSGSSTSSSNSTSSCTNNNTSTLQNYHSSNTDNNKESKHQRQRTSSNNNNTPINNASSTISSSAAGTQQVTFGGSSKKRQLNFELELTKDLHLVNSVPANSGKHKRQDDGQGHTSVKKSRKDSSSLAKEDQKSGSSKTHHKTISVTTTTALSSSSVHVEKSQEREKKPSPAVNVTTSVSSKSSFSSSSSSIVQAQTENPPSTSNSSHLEDVTRVVNVCTPSPSVNIIREHPTLPHFNNVVLTSATSANSTSITVPALPTAVISQTQIPPTPAQNIPVHITNSGCAAPPQMQSAALIPNLSPSLAGNTVASPTPNASSHLPFFNTIYGKLLDNPAPTLSSPVPGPCSAVSSIAAPNITPTAASQGVLSEYLDTKLKSYNTLGGYVNHTALFGLNNTPSKDVNLTKEGTNEMPAPPAPSAISGSAASSSSSLSLTLNVSTSPAMKILTKTASHDPRLNPQLTAPEPPPQPKRKLSINEYRKRMQQTSSNDSASNSLTSTPSTPPTPIENPPVGGGSIATVVLNKCTLNSPERLTQSVDSQIQKEIIASSSLNSYDSLNSSNSSSTSNSSLMNDSLLKSSSLAEEDSTKGMCV